LPRKKQIPLYEVHDYSAVETYIRNQNERRELAIHAGAKAASAHRLKYVALVIASCGFAALLVLFGVSLLNEEKIREIEKVVEKIVPVEKVVEKIIPVERASKENSLILKRIKELEKIEKNQQGNNSLESKSGSINQKPSNSPDITTRFNVFKQIPSRIYGFGDVVTGHVYANSKTNYPEEQYCYVELKSNGIRKARMDLGRKAGRKGIAWQPWVLTSSHEISPSQFKDAKTKCQFI